MEENLAGEGEYVRLEVADTGQGIPAEKKRWVFEPFHSNFPDGTGLGLTLLRDTLTMMGGAIRETGGPGAGARFLLMFPVHPTVRKERA